METLVYATGLLLLLCTEYNEAVVPIVVNTWGFTEATDAGCIVDAD